MLITDNYGGYGRSVYRLPAMPVGPVFRRRPVTPSARIWHKRPFSPFIFPQRHVMIPDVPLSLREKWRRYRPTVQRPLFKEATVTRRTTIGGMPCTCECSVSKTSGLLALMHSGTFHK